MGVPVSGVLDRFAARVANWLVGNPDTAAVLEITVIGPHLEVQQDADVALTGAEMTLLINNQPAPGWSSCRVKPGDMIRFGMPTGGCRGYLAVSGGIAVAPVMGSRSTYIGGRLGGIAGRPLVAGDLIQRGHKPLLERPRQLPAQWIRACPNQIVLRAMQGPQQDAFTDSLELFFSTQYEVSPKADRMGYRLSGTSIHHDANHPASIISEPSMPGNVQIPSDGKPIILLVEQTVGGYSKIATVISSDLDRVGQAMPGDTIRFVQVSLERAHAIFRQRQRRFKEIKALLCG
jgi:biotin-dependent carboxylase-like uncharacterized protein